MKLSAPQQLLLDTLDRTGPRSYSWLNTNVLRTARSLEKRQLVTITSTDGGFGFEVRRAVQL